jgi:hypothetical protein
MSNFHEISDAEHLRKLRDHTVSVVKLGSVGEYSGRRVG